MRMLDRYIIRNFLLNYLLAMLVLIGMYTLLDLIVNLDRFIKGAKIAGNAGVLSLMGDIADYYMYQSLVMFQQVTGVIPILAAAFTMVRMSRHNELTAMLSSGVSLYRVAAPIVLLSTAFSLLAVLDQEVIMPAVQDKLMRKHDEIRRTAKAPQNYMIMPDGKNDLLLFAGYDRAKKELSNVWMLSRDEGLHVVRRVMANKATWRPAENDWVLSGDVRYADDIIPGAPGQTATDRVADGALTHSTGLKPEHVELFLSKRAVDFLSLTQVMDLIGSSTPNTKPTLEKMMHIRVTQPIMNVIMLLLGIPFLLTREPGRLVKSIFLCLVVCGNCFAATFMFYQMGDLFGSPLLAAWMPALIFLPVALAMLDSIKT